MFALKSSCFDERKQIFFILIFAFCFYFLLFCQTMSGLPCALRAWSLLVDSAAETITIYFFNFYFLPFTFYFGWRGKSNKVNYQILPRPKPALEQHVNICFILSLYIIIYHFTG